MKLKTTLLAACAAFAIALPAQAIVSITIDTGANTITLDGSTTEGTPFDTGGNGLVIWQFTTGSVISFTGTPTLSGSSSSSHSSISNLNVGYTDDISSVTGLGVEIFLSSSVATTITYTSLVFDYSALPVDAVAYIDAIPDGSTASLIDGTGFGDATITSVPEPSTYAALAGLAALVFVALRRRK